VKLAVSGGRGWPWALPAMRHRRRKLIACIAALAMLLGMFAPGIARAMALRADVAIGMELCRTGGKALLDRAAVNPAGPADRGAPTAVLSASDCPCCLAHASAAVLPATPAAVLPPVPASRLPGPQAAYEAPRPARAWDSARPRAPPPQG
jgi:hypothetical protein